MNLNCDKAMKIFSAFGLLIQLSAADLSFADEPQIHNCNGRWTNQPCDPSEIKEVLKTDSTRKVMAPDEAKKRSEKQSLFHTLTMKNIEAKRELGIEIDISSADQLCFEKPSSAAECRAEIEKLEDRLDRRISAAAALKRKETAENEKREKEKKQAPPAENNAVVVQEVIPFDGRRNGEQHFDNNSFRQGGQLENGSGNVIVGHSTNSTPPKPSGAGPDTSR